MLKRKARLAIPAYVLAVVCAAYFAVPAIAGSAGFNYELPWWQGNVTVATGFKDSTSSSYATVALDRRAGGGIFWIDKGYNNRKTDSVTINSGSGNLYYWGPGPWSGAVQLRSCTSYWGPSSNRTIGVVNFG
jgi:hypothetical protein